MGSRLRSWREVPRSVVRRRVTVVTGCGEEGVGVVEVESPGVAGTDRYIGSGKGVSK